MNNKILLGEINGVFGVQGWVKVFSDTKPRENIYSYPNWYLAPKSSLRGQKNRADEASSEEPADFGADWVPVKVLSGRIQGKNVVVRLDGINDRDGALNLVGQQIAISRSQLPELSAGEYYWSDLIGFTVIDVHGRTLGLVDRMFETGANDVMVVRRVGNQEILVPWLRDTVVKVIDVAAACIEVDWDPDF